MVKAIHGRIRGKTIEFDEEIGFADGEEVEIVIRLVRHQRPWGEGLKCSAGALADSWTEEDDEILAEIQQDRKRSTQREIPE